MKLPSFRPPSLREIPGAPENADYFDQLLEPRDSHVKTLTDCLQGQTSVGDNLNAEVRTLKVSHGVESPITLQKLRGKAVGATVINAILAAGEPLPLMAFRVVDESKVAVTFYADTDPGEPFSVTFIVWGS